jgi:hypothetical protein
VQLARDSREFAHVAFRHVPANASPPEIYLAGAWRPMTWFTATGAQWDALLFEFGTTQAEVDNGTVKLARVLVAGPDADPGNAVVLPLNRTTPRVRLTDNPEVIVRPTEGPIDVA